MTKIQEPVYKTSTTGVLLSTCVPKRINRETERGKGGPDKDLQKERDGGNVGFYP